MVNKRIYETRKDSNTKSFHTAVSMVTSLFMTLVLSNFYNDLLTIPEAQRVARDAKAGTIEF